MTKPTHHRRENMKKLTQKQREVLDHMWSAWFARSMTLTDFSRRTVNSLEQAGLISWDAEADAKPGASGPAKFGLTHYGFAVCEREFGPRRKQERKHEKSNTQSSDEKHRILAGIFG